MKKYNKKQELNKKIQKTKKNKIIAITTAIISLILVAFTENLLIATKNILVTIPLLGASTLFLFSMQGKTLYAELKTNSILKNKQFNKEEEPKELALTNNKEKTINTIYKQTKIQPKQMNTDINTKPKTRTKSK